MRARISQMRKQKFLLTTQKTTRVESIDMKNSDYKNIPNKTIKKFSLSSRAHTLEEKTIETERYFSPEAKAKFMRTLVDGYFDNSENKKVVKTEKSSTQRKFRLSRPQSLKKAPIPTAQSPERCHSMDLSPNPASQPHTPYSELPPICESPRQHTQESITYFRERFEQKIYIESNALFQYYILPSTQLIYKEYLIPGTQLLKREQKAIQYGVKTLWTPSPHCSLISTCPFLHTLCDINWLKQKNRILWAKKVIIKITTVLKEVQGRIGNNYVCLKNIRIKGLKICIDKWHHSTFTSTYNIQGKIFKSKTYPILKAEGEWIVEPWYLAPELLEQIGEEGQGQGGEGEEKGDVWGLGVAVLEIVTGLTLVGGENDKWKAGCGSSGKIFGNKGLLGTQNGQLKNIIQALRKLSSSIPSILQNCPQPIPKQLRFLITKMLAFNPKQRISFNQILEIIN